MFRRISTFFKEKGIAVELASILIGILMLAALVIYSVTMSRLALYAVIILGGFLTIFNGFKYKKDKDKRNMGYSMILFGIVILIMFVLFIGLGLI